MAENQFKCHFCKTCLGRGCIGQMPGMGGVNQSRNFILNCDGWDKLPVEEGDKVLPENLGIGPVTGAIQNIGYANEEDFYLPYFTAAKNKGITVCVGDGAPDEKLMLGLKAVQTLGIKAHFFLKPYPNPKLMERIDWIKNDACAIGIDIDAYNIVSMRNQAKLERKTLAQLKEFRDYSKLPLMLKGVFTKEDIELCKIVKPEVIVVSNHGGRVETAEGSSAEFLVQHGKELKGYCQELWVDGGIRKARDVLAAKKAGAAKALAARPFIAGLCKAGIPGMEASISQLF